VSGYEIALKDIFGTVFTIIDCDTGDEIERAEAETKDTRYVRAQMIGQVRHLNGREDLYA
jgi:hypothetical protein